MEISDLITEALEVQANDNRRRWEDRLSDEARTFFDQFVDACDDKGMSISPDTILRFMKAKFPDDAIGARNTIKAAVTRRRAER